MVIKEIEDAIPTLNALNEDGLPVAEITFRTACAEEAKRLGVKSFPDMYIGAGTVINDELSETAKDRVMEQLAKLDEKLKKLTRMRLEDEITRESYFEFKSEIEKKTRFTEQTAGAGCGNCAERKSGRSGEKGERFFAGENGFYRPSYRQRRNRSVRRHDCSRYRNVFQLVYEFRLCIQIRRYEKARVGVYDRL